MCLARNAECVRPVGTCRASRALASCVPASVHLPGFLSFNPAHASLVRITDSPRENGVPLPRSLFFRSAIIHAATPLLPTGLHRRTPHTPQKCCAAPPTPKGGTYEGQATCPGSSWTLAYRTQSSTPVPGNPNPDGLRGRAVHLGHPGVRVPSSAQATTAPCRNLRLPRTSRCAVSDVRSAWRKTGQLQGPRNPEPVGGRAGAAQGRSTAAALSIAQPWSQLR